MFRTSRILKDLKAKGLRFRTDGRQVFVSGPLTQADAETIRKHKAELLSVLEYQAATAFLRARLAEHRATTRAGRFAA